jgi:NAD(P)H-hydrate epimerase
MSDVDDFGFPIASGFPAIDAPGMTEVDLLMVHSYGIALPQMMENAGRALALVARRRYLPGDLAGRQVVVLAGSGGNGGGAMVAARRLAGWGAQVSLVLSADANTLRGVPADQFAILTAMGIVPVELPTESTDLILDGMTGYSLRGAPSGRAAELIDWANRQTAPTLALDVPSGFDAISGTIHQPTIRADATLTLALPKLGLQASAITNTVGALYLADISVPPGLYRRLSPPLDVPPFASGDILRLTIT